MNESRNPEDLALQDIPEVWFEKGRFHASIPAYLGGLATGFAFRHIGPDINAYMESVTCFMAATSATLFDRKSSRDLLSSISLGQREGIDYGYYETNEYMGQIESREDFVRESRSPKILAMDAAFIGVACLGWPFAGPIAGMRGIAGMNNRRKMRRINRAIEYTQAME